MTDTKAELAFLDERLRDPATSLLWSDRIAAADALTILRQERNTLSERLEALEYALITIRDRRHACNRAADCQHVARSALRYGRA